jgi:hypothetical protein
LVHRAMHELGIPLIHRGRDNSGGSVFAERDPSRRFVAPFALRSLPGHFVNMQACASRHGQMTHILDTPTPNNICWSVSHRLWVSKMKGRVQNSSDSLLADI